ncbi:MAG TPA: lysylphosphatidylglycerol synthase transmembrane domain-containing protein [Vicinamibacterales bacterium]|nr:lysylphosphatidylglycerol synthase transmembrane domain-containing protein [Vicinamibacterales bacterium]
MPETDTQALPRPVSAPAPPTSRRRPGGATLLSLALSAIILAALYRSIDARLIFRELRSVDKGLLLVSVAMIVPITVLRAIRFYLVAPRGTVAGVAEALRLTLVATAANVFMPAKSGDLIKSYFVAKERTPVGVSVAVVVYERLCDLAGLITWCALGWVVARPVVAGVPSALWPVLGLFGLGCGLLVSSSRIARFGAAVVERLHMGRLQRVQSLVDGWPGLFRSLGRRRAGVILLSMLLWLIHVIQIWMFTVALSIRIPFTVSASLSAVALMIGQLPFSFAGLGARDVALVVLMRAYVRPESAAALGLLISTRNLLPPLAALPIMRPYVAKLAAEVRMR